MKALHFAVVAAVLLVAALLAFMALSGGERGTTGRAGGREDGAAREGATAEPAREPGAKGTDAGAGALSITLTVVGPDDAPAGGAVIELDGGGDSLRAAADADGKLAVRGLAPGIYDLRARRGNLAGALHFELKRPRDLGTLKLSASVAIRGHVFGPRGEPLPGARVEACRAVERAAFDVMTAVRGMAEPEEVVARAAAGDDGAYELAVPAGGTCGLRASAKGFAQEGEPARAYTADADGVDFWLTPGALLQGRVLDARQAPVAAARVLVADPMGLFGRRVPKAETATGADGSFSMVVTPTEQSMLVVRAAGFASHMQPNLHLPQADLVIVLEKGVALRLRTVDAERPETPAPRVSVIAMYRGGFGAGETDDLGCLLLENLPTKGTGMGNQQQIFLWGGGYIAQTLDLGRQEPVDGVVDAGDVKLAPGGVVRGRVLDKTTGDGIAGARVRSFGGLDPQLQIFGAVTAVSAGDGTFVLTGVPLGAHSLVATHADFVGDVDPARLFGVMGGGSGGPPLFPEGSRDVERDIEMTPAEAVAGLVRAPDGSPVAGATVEEAGDENLILSRLLGSGSTSATSDANGGFVLRGVRPGTEVTLVATHRDYGPSESVRVRAGERVTLQLAEPLTIKGVVVDEQGEAVANVRASVERTASPGPRTPFDSGPVRPSITDGEGRYLLRNAPAGQLTVTFDHPDYRIARKEVSVSASSDLGRTVLARGGTIEGTAVDDGGQPVPSLPVYAWHRGQGADGRTNANTVTDENGRFALRGLADGEYQLRAWDGRYYCEEISVRTGATDVRLLLRTAGKLLGRVTARGLAVGGANVRAKRGDDFVGWAETAPDGTFAMESLPPDQPLELTVEHDAFRKLTVEAVLTSERTQEFVLHPGIEVAGRVVDAAGRGVAGARVTVRVEGGQLKSVETDATGAFTAGGLDDGRITVRLEESDQGFIPTEWVEVAAGARGVRLVATPGESISGIVRDGDGKPVRGASIEARDAAGVHVASDFAWREDGAFELRGLRPGTYTVRAQRALVPGEQQPQVREVPGVAAGTKGLEIRFDR
jgi:protocatechuate 3,4-dioxygenase beta subunit